MPHHVVNMIACHINFKALQRCYNAAYESRGSGQYALHVCVGVLSLHS